MPDSLESTEEVVELRDKLANAYRKLPPLEQKILQLTSVIYEPVSRTKLLACLNSMKVLDADKKTLVMQTLKGPCDRLSALNLLVSERSQGVECHPLLTEIVTRDAVKNWQFAAIVEAVEKCLPIGDRWQGGPRFFTSERGLIREVRIGIYRNDLEFIEKQFESYRKYSYQTNKLTLDEVLWQVCNNPFDPEWFRTLTPELYVAALDSILTDSILDLTPADAAFELLQADCAEGKTASEAQRVFLIEQLILRGDLAEAEVQIDRLPSSHEGNIRSLRGWIKFLLGEDEQAIADYTVALQILKKGAGKRKVYFQSVSGLFFILALLKQGSADRLHEAAGYVSVARQAKHWLSSTYEVLEHLVKMQQGELHRKALITSTAPFGGDYSLELLFQAFCLYWVDVDRAKTALPKLLEPFYHQAEAAGYVWIAMETAELLAKLKPRSQFGKLATDFRHDSGIRPIVELLQPQEAWELCLNALTNLQKPTQTSAKPESNQRLVWSITYYPSSGCMLQPREQSVNAKGEWSKGRPIALKRLKDQPETFGYMTAQDLQVCAHIKAYTVGYYGKVEYSFGDRAIAALVGHPLVFWEDTPTVRIEVVKGEPELLVKKTKDSSNEDTNGKNGNGKGRTRKDSKDSNGNGSSSHKDSNLIIQFSPELKSDSDILVVKESPTRLNVIEITPEHRRIAEILGKQNRLEVPDSAKERVLAAISAVSGIVTVQSDIGGGMANAEEVPADPKPHVHLLPAGEGLKVAVLSRPFAQAGSYYRPGTGGETVIAEIDGKRLQTTRNLREEKQLANAAIAACPILVQEDQTGGEWLVEDPENCLELLLELQALEDSIALEWPQGEKMRVSHEAGFKNFSMKIQRQNDWFATSGELKLDDQHVLDMQRLMELLDQTPSRFIPLGDGQFVALTQEFRKRLDELRAFSDKQGKNLRVHPLAALTIEDWAEEVGSLKTDKAWKDHIQRIKDAQNFEPTLPSTLQADLRDYQIDGFRWLARLAHWGVGACLADDMGLGKTLQSLALILTRAPAGATLIVAPTSVGMNWISEAQKFAPTLNPIQFGSGDRQKLLDNLQPFDLLICSYGLLQQEEVAEMLAKVEWQTIVLDEAQSIKNFATKRSQAAMSLQGGFKLLTTGTPIENHLGELWNLFRFINPGLLGSLESFNQRFATPIERYQDKQARNQLKKLIQPFLLRRTKTQVLEELPSRTEILLQVELSQAELAFYEALRQESIAKLADSDATAGAKHLQVLAEIMRLRRACCNPSLVKPELALPSSKLQLFGEVLAELLENNHKALVFSQFVDHLHILRDYLDEQQISYQYLDGSTPAAQRKKRVDAFQAGEGDVFLISLKAGGTGLNLTAADYVIHMDPWWNPAVEDQASDRAHRIGQYRPVTIYRLVAKHTIEEKIVQLHHSKRDLADSLLEGADMSGKTSTDDLLRLISEG